MDSTSERHTHESFGQIRFSRVSGKANFYGSELEHNHYISLEIHQSEIDRTLSQDWHHNTGPMVMRLRMTAGQFSELITSMNYGSGVCCTMEYREGKKIQQLPEQESRKEFVHRKFADKLKDFGEKVDTIKENILGYFGKKSLTKADKESAERQLNSLTSEIKSNIPFVAKCYQETVDEMTYEAKLEVENAIISKVTTLGLKALHDENKLLGN